MKDVSVNRKAKKWLKGHPTLTAAGRHFVLAAVASFVLTIVPVVSAVGAGGYNVETTKALVLAAITGAIAAGARAVGIWVADKANVGGVEEV